jgi:DnaJ-class molecular chaperone
MKRINQYKKLFSVEGAIDLKSLKKTYRDLVKEWHPDKFMEGEVGQEEAEFKSREIIDGYHFLVSIAPETKAANLETYNEIINTEGILDFQHKGLTLEITFTNGFTYEYFGVPKNVFIKFLNSDKQIRFGKRAIFHSYLYRIVKKEVQPA